MTLWTYILKIQMRIGRVNDQKIQQRYFDIFHTFYETFQALKIESFCCVLAGWCLADISPHRGNILKSSQIGFHGKSTFIFFWAMLTTEGALAQYKGYLAQYKDVIVQCEGDFVQHKGYLAQYSSTLGQYTGNIPQIIGVLAQKSELTEAPQTQ